MKKLFRNKHLAKWAGICPSYNESGGKKCSITTHGNQYLKPVLVECAWSVTWTKGTYFRAKFESLVGRKGS
jgi:transposase